MTISRPALLPEFASGVGASFTEPSSGVKQTGWEFEQAPPFDVMNWIHRATWKWARYFDTLLKTVFPIGLSSGGAFTLSGSNWIVEAGAIISNGQRYEWNTTTIDTVPSGYTGPAHYRLDLILFKWSYASNDAEAEVQFDYLEDAQTNPIPSGWSAYAAIIVRQSLGAYDVEDSFHMIANAAVAYGKEVVVVRDGRGHDQAGADGSGLRMIQAAIDYLADRGGGVVRLIGERFGYTEWDGLADNSASNTPIKLKSGVIIDGRSACIRAPRSDVHYSLLLPTLIDISGSTATAETAPAGLTPNHLLCNTIDFEEYGRGSAVWIKTGADAGWYLIEDLVTTHLVKLCDMHGQRVTLSNDTPTIEVCIYRAGVIGLRFSAVDSAMYHGGTSIRSGYTRDCIIADNIIEANYTTGFMLAGIDLRVGSQLGLVLTGNKISGLLQYGIIGEGSYERESCLIVNNKVACTGMGSSTTKGIVIESSGAGKGVAYGNEVFGFLISESYPAAYGMYGYPFTTEHSALGVHKTDNGVTTSGNKIVANVDAATIDVNGSKQLYVRSTPYECAGWVNSDGTEQTLTNYDPPGPTTGMKKSVVFLGTDAFPTDAGTYDNWYVRADVTPGGTEYQIRPPHYWVEFSLSPTFYESHNNFAVDVISDGGGLLHIRALRWLRWDKVKYCYSILWQDETAAIAATSFYFKVTRVGV